MSWGMGARRRAGLVERTCESENGAAAAVFGLTLAALCLTAGAGLDMARWLAARSQTRAAIDSAVLAGARVLQLNPADAAGAIGAAERYYAVNAVDRPAILSDTVTFGPADGNTAFAARGAVSMPTVFLKLAGIDELPLVGSGTDEVSKAEIAAGRHAETNLEIALVLDTSDSMGGQRLAEVKTAAAELVDVVIWDDQSRYTSRMSLIPYSGDVRLPQSWNAAARGTGLPAAISQATSCTVLGRAAICRRQHLLTSCVAERSGGERYTAAAPGAGAYVTARYSPDGLCSQPGDNEIQALSADRNELHARIGALQAASGAAGHLGVAWGWYTLSANWRAVLPASGEPARAGARAQRKFAILVSSGAFDTAYSVAGIRAETNGPPAANGTSLEQAVELCSAMKAEGITVYAVGFEVADAMTAGALSQCASGGGRYYGAGDGTALRHALRDIALDLSRLHLVN